MSIAERKYSLIEKIMMLEGQDFEKLESKVSEDIDFQLAIAKAQSQVREGQTKPHEEVRRKYEKWLEN